MKTFLLFLVLAVSALAQTPGLVGVKSTPTGFQLQTFTYKDEGSGNNLFYAQNFYTNTDGSFYPGCQQFAYIDPRFRGLYLNSPTGWVFFAPGSVEYIAERDETRYYFQPINGQSPIVQDGLCTYDGSKTYLSFYGPLAPPKLPGLPAILNYKVAELNLTVSFATGAPTAGHSLIVSNAGGQIAYADFVRQ